MKRHPSLLAGCALAALAALAIFVAGRPAPAEGSPRPAAPIAVALGSAVVAPLLLAAGATETPHHPNLFYNEAELHRMREKTRELPWARDIFAGLKKDADAWVARQEDPPAEQGGWSHDYACPDDGARLLFRADQPRKHLCPTCKKEWEGPKFDATWRATMHGEFAEAARNMALVYQLTGEERYARGAAHILIWYADHYASFPLGRGPAGKGKVMSQSLTECTFLITLMDAADLAYPALTPPERTHVENDLIRPGAEHISHYTFGIHNIQCWHNACLACAGYFLGDSEMTRRARTGPLGFDSQVEKGILEDGMWFERSLGYHGYTLSALVAYCEAARHAGEDLYVQGRIRLMFTVPLRLAQPNLVLPSLNDQGYSRSPIGTESLERAVAWYHDEDAERALNMLLDRGAKRSGLTALHYGEALPDAGPYVPPGSVDMPGAGFAILRRGRGDAAECAMVEYGDHGGGHGHPDKLQLILYGLGETLCPDAGTTGYGAALHGRWFKTTPGHNTVTIGHKSQKPTCGKLLAFETKESYAAATVESGGAYPGYRLVRRLLLGDGFLVDVFSVAGEAPETLDWFLRAPGKLSLSAPTQPITEEAPSATYAYLTGLRGATSDTDWSATWGVGEKGERLVVTMRGEPGSEAAQCLAPGVPGEEPWHTLRVRRQAAATRFVAVYQMLPAGKAPAPVTFADDRITVGKATVLLGASDDVALALQ